MAKKEYTKQRGGEREKIGYEREIEGEDEKERWALMGKGTV